MKYHLPQATQTSWSSCRYGRRLGLISIELNSDAAAIVTGTPARLSVLCIVSSSEMLNRAMWLASERRAFDLHCHPPRLSARRGRIPLKVDTRIILCTPSRRCLSIR
jgi:hypothetical protein